MNYNSIKNKIKDRYNNSFDVKFNDFNKDKQREKLIFEAIPGIQLKRVKERDYRKNPEKIVNECVEWILENEKIW